MIQKRSDPNAGFIRISSYMKGQLYDHMYIPQPILNKGIRVLKNEEWEDLLKNVATSGCRDSFKKIFAHFYPSLIQQGLKNGLSKEVSSELAQDAMIKVWNQAYSFDQNKGNASLWIYVIARNIRFDYLRAQKHRELDISSFDVYQDEFEVVLDLKDKLTELPIEQRTVIEKIYILGMTQQEVALEEGIPLGTVKSRVRLAMATIKQLMEADNK